MYDFNILIAGVAVRIEALFRSTENFCREYMTCRTPEFAVKILQADIDYERQKSLEGDYTDAYLEVLAVYRKIVQRLIDYDILLFHGSAVAVDGQAYIFAALSGTGKTTHSKLWLKNIPNSFIVNGDKPLLRIREDGVTVCGTPWQGKENFGQNIEVPLRAVCILERDTSNHIEQITGEDALPVLFQQSYRPESIEAMGKTMELIGRLGTGTMMFRLGCNMSDEAAFVAYNGMNKN